MGRLHHLYSAQMEEWAENINTLSLADISQQNEIHCLHSAIFNRFLPPSRC